MPSLASSAVCRHLMANKKVVGGWEADMGETTNMGSSSESAIFICA